MKPMSKRIFLNAGHGGKDVGATGHGLREKDLNLTLVKLIEKKLNEQYEGFVIKRYRSGDEFRSLADITQTANKWNADLFVSIHINAGGGSGFESFIYNGRVPERTSNYHAIIHGAIIQNIHKYKVADRGKKRANFHVLRETKMPAILTETLFIDSKKDSELLKDESFLNDVAQGHVEGIANCLKLKKKEVNKEVNKEQVFYRVVTGSFTKRKNAEKRVKELQEKGYQSFIEIFRK